MTKTLRCVRLCKYECWNISISNFDRISRKFTLKCLCRCVYFIERANSFPIRLSLHLQMHRHSLTVLTALQIFRDVCYAISVCGRFSSFWWSRFCCHLNNETRRRRTNIQNSWICWLCTHIYVHIWIKLRIWFIAYVLCLFFVLVAVLDFFFSFYCINQTRVKLK